MKRAPFIYISEIMASLTKFEVSQAETTWFLDDHFHDPSAECSVHLGGQSDVVGNGQVKCKCGASQVQIQQLEAKNGDLGSMVCLCITDNTEINLGMEVAVEIGVPIHLLLVVPMGFPYWQMVDEIG